LNIEQHRITLNNNEQHSTTLEYLEHCTIKLNNKTIDSSFFPMYTYLVMLTTKIAHRFQVFTKD